MANDNGIAEKKLLHDYHAAFYKLFHLPLDWLKPDDRAFTVCGKEHCNALCARIMEAPTGARKCAALAHARVTEAKRTGEPVLNRCHAGFYDALIPIFTHGEYVGSLCIGQFLTKTPDDADLVQIQQELDFLNLDLAELREYCRKTRVLTPDELEGLIALVRMLGEYICESYDRMRFLDSISRTDPVKAAEKYIQLHYSKILTVGGIARSVGMSPSYFLHKFSEQTGLSPIAYLNSFRVEKACELLKNSSLDIAEIARSCGFRSVPHFNRMFRQLKARTPREYRLSKRSAASLQ